MTTETIQAKASAHRVSLPPITVLIARHWGALLTLGVSTLLILLAFKWMGYHFSAIGRALIGDQVDTNLGSWMLYQAYRNLLSGDLSASPLFWGEPAPFALMHGMYGVALLTLPLYWLTSQNLALTYNLYLIAAFPLTALVAYLWVRDLIKPHPLTAMLAALLITFTPQRFYHISRIEFALLLPFFIALIALRRVLERPRIKWAVVLGFTAGYTLLLSAYLGYILVVIGGIITLYTVVRRFDLLNWRLVGMLALAAAIGIGINLPFTLFRFQNPLFVQNHNVDEIVYFAPSLSDWFVGFSHLYWPAHGDPQYLGWGIERSMFLGFVVLILAALGCRWRRYGAEIEGILTRTETLTLYAIITITGYILALGPILKWNDRPIFPLPYTLLLSIPGFTGIRFPSRFILLAVIGTALLAAHALTVMRARLDRRMFALLAAAISVGLLLEYLPFNGDTSRRFPGEWPDERHVQLQTRSPEPHPPIYDWLAEQPPDTVVFHYPHMLSGEFIAQYPYRMNPFAMHEYVLYQRIHNQPTVQGVASIYPEWFFRLDWGSFPNIDIMEFLRERGVEYILIHHEMMIETESLRFEGRLREFESMWGAFSFVERVGDVDVYALAPGDFTYYEFHQTTPIDWNWYPPVQTEEGITYQISTVANSVLPVMIQPPAERGVSMRVVALSDPALLDEVRLQVNGIEIPLDVVDRRAGTLAGTIPAEAISTTPEPTSLRFYLGPGAVNYPQPSFGLDWVRLSD